MRKTIAALVVTAACSQAHAQIPVTDAASIGQDLTHHLERVIHYKEQYDKLVEQYNQMVETHEALTDTRNLGDVFDDPTLRRYLPDDWLDAYRALKRSGYEGLAREAVRIYRENQIEDACDHLDNDVMRRNCEAKAIKGAMDQGYAVEAYQKSEERTEQILLLQEEINETVDPKGIAELQARIQIEQIAIANEQQKMELFRMINASEDRMIDQRQREVQSIAMDGEEGIDFEPLSFDGW